MAYATTIIEVGPNAGDFLAENMAITFAGDAPEALRPFCFIIESATLDGDLAVGQGVSLADQTWQITALGEIAQKNLAGLGHVTLVFDGASEAQLPGAVHLGGIEDPPALALGNQVVFHSE